MANKRFLNDNGTQIWPITRADCIYTLDGKNLLSNILENINYDELLAFDTSEIVFDSSGDVSTSSVLGKGKLNRLILK